MRYTTPSTRLKLLAVGTLVGLVATACAGVGAVEPNESGEVIITLTDNVISPSVIKVKPGQTVRFIITNEGEHVHELMIGRDPIRGENYLTERVWTPWGGEDFFAGLEISVEGGMAMNFEGMAMEMDEGEMADGEMEMDDDGDTGGMVLLQPGAPGSSDSGEVSVMEFVVPEDAVGTWQIGCFQEAGQHYEDGMRATLVVEA